jgi:murein DD-endopeptidase MepM/ murein hydrolase activator NlpD
MPRPPPRTHARPPHPSPRRTVSVLLASLALCVATSVAADPAPPKGNQAQNSAARAAAREQAASRARAERLGLGTLKAAGKLLQGRVEQAWLRAAGPDVWLGALRLPVTTGHVSRGFGSGKGGYHQAVDIAGALGTTVRTAAPGIVGYANDDVAGYGNLIIIIHPGAFITTYAHNQKLSVVAGQRVRRGQSIATLGSTGRSMGPHLHTELLWNGLNCDPLPLFRPQARDKHGAPAVARLSLWKDPHKKPKVIRCAPRKHHPDYGKDAGNVDDEDGEIP